MILVSDGIEITEPKIRERKEFPKVEVDTKIGKLYVIVTGQKTVSVRTLNSIHVTVNGVNYDVTVYLKKSDQDEWIPDYHSGYSINREKYWQYRINATESARTTIKEIVLTYAKTVTDKMPDLAVEAERTILNNTMADLQQREEAAITALRQVREEQAIVLEKEKELNKETI